MGQCFCRNVDDDLNDVYNGTEGPDTLFGEEHYMGISRIKVVDETVNKPTYEIYNSDNFYLFESYGIVKTLVEESKEIVYIVKKSILEFVSFYMYDEKKELSRIVVYYNHKNKLDFNRPLIYNFIIHKNIIVSCMIKQLNFSYVKLSLDTDRQTDQQTDQQTDDSKIFNNVKKYKQYTYRDGICLNAIPDALDQIRQEERRFIDVGNSKVLNNGYPITYIPCFDSTPGYFKEYFIPTVYECMKYLENTQYDANCSK